MYMTRTFLNMFDYVNTLEIKESFIGAATTVGFNSGSIE